MCRDQRPYCKATLSPLTSLKGDDRPDISFEKSPKVSRATHDTPCSLSEMVPHEEYAVFIDRTSWNQKMPLGLELKGDEDLVVSGIQRYSLIYDWNMQFVDSRVELLDRVLSVNGIGDSKEAILRELERKNCMTKISLTKY
eukprot:gnl/MRDRNA2_/MRDRNA2_152899_c0_seq1.p1 gnl/MRDRNA2_/MRDRNA2_152899_c0~~gnl/MRDRNA2_/MRDRNA2_152899_c0_seq1.p1  ORF type:complete len:141 (+),score=14.92 gnl/MRDRNA2_/MRDRNA2_152899_c0_seq1:105-527(+)